MIETVKTPYFNYRYLLGITILWASLGGCMGNLGVATEMLYPALPGEYTFAADPRRVWQCAREIVAERSEAELLASDSNHMIMSWAEELRATSIDLEDGSGIDNALTPEQITKYEAKEVGNGSTAITTVYVRATENGTLMRIRRVYYGALTQPMLAHSRGSFAKYFARTVKAQLNH